METNYLGLLICGVLSLVLGFIWYGPLFGKKWMEIIGVNGMDKEKMKEMQKGMWKLYATSFALALFQAHVLSYFIQMIPGLSAFHLALWLWAGLVVPVVAGASMWTNDSSITAWSRFLILAGYQLVLVEIFALVLGR